MITMKELNSNGYTLTPEQEKNIKELYDKINIIRKEYGRPMRVTSGIRSIEKHVEVYLKKGIPLDKIPMGSKHLSGQAVDIYDPDSYLQLWCIAHEKLLEEVGLWMEDFSATPNWCHFQTVPPKSGSRFFIP